MKIVQIIPAFMIGGAETMCETLINELNKSDNEIFIISLFNIHTLITKRLEDNGHRIIYLNKKKGFDLSIFNKLFHIFKEIRPDVVHMHLNSTIYALPISVITKVKKRIYTVHSLANKEGNVLYRILNFIFIHFFKMIPVALTDEIKNSINKVYKYNKINIPVVFNGIDLNKCRIKNCYKIHEKAHIIHIGRFEEAKNHKLIVDSLKKMIKLNSKIELKLIGDGSKKKDIEKYIKEEKMNDYIILTGNKESCFEDLYNSDIFILPSKWEGMPMTLIEAMGTGLPCIVSNVGGIPNIIDNNENGVIIKPEIDNLVESLNRLLNDELLRKTIGKNARKKSMFFSSEDMAKKYLKLYEE